MTPTDALNREHQQYRASADQCVAAAAWLASRDPLRPRYHLTPPAQWMNDPNGPVFFDGEYHLFYQHNPYGSVWGNMSWGHAVSTDLVRWKHLPIALVPNPEGYDRAGVYSGCCVDHEGIPHILYTAVDHQAAQQQTQALAYSHDRLITWTKAPQPVIPNAPDGPVPDFRDPFCWREGDTWNMALCHASTATKSVVRYTSKDLRQWEYRGVIYDQFSNVPECPNLFPLGDKWLLTVSPYGDVIYALGDYRDGQFLPQGPWQALDLGGSAAFYAPNTLFDLSGQKMMWGWVRGGGSPQSPWNGCFSLPRVLDLANDKTLTIHPHAALTSLRGAKREYGNLQLDAGVRVPLPELPGPGTELTGTFKVGEMSRCGLEIAGAGPEGKPLTITYDAAKGRLSCGTAGGTFRLPVGERLELRVFLDRSVLEIYANSRAALTARFHPKNPARPELFAWSDGESLAHLTAWALADI